MFRKIFLYPGPLWRLTATFSWLSATLAVLVVAPLFLLATLLGFPLHWQTAIIRFWFRWVCATCFFKFEVIHRGDYDPASACLVVSNHQSLFDIPAAFFAFSGNLRMVAKRELFWIPLFGQAMRAGGFIPHFRSSRASSAKVLRQIERRFKGGMQIWVAPEGTRSEDGRLGDYRWGSFGLAISAQIPIQPIVVLNSREALPRSAFLPRVGTTIYVVALPQISTAGLKSSDRGTVAKRVHQLSAEVLAHAR
ncbi:MAG TPA: lysophospholipid acyltransferase family protein [Bdellovibrionota bacterium]|nr:lysophospholipid acyltransferase family protein [Bdellovibrionota bacterium]